ncbi:MAG: hypothetical protein LLF90_05905 [Methanomicrobiaceae archaeon]|nr:hypothetical protein [Methanomicrobiaceae archaeon]
MVVKTAEAIIANPNGPKALTIPLEARAKMAMKNGGKIRPGGNLFGVPGDSILYPEER